MSAAAEVSSGKGHRDENFPVASWLIARRHRPIILAFYRFVRMADDVADHATLDPAEKLALLDRLERSLLGREDSEAAGVALRSALAARRLPPRHALDLLTAFRLDVTKRRYADWNDLMDYCAFSAMPVGRFVLDVHGEARSTWPASDALCAALQVINHLQDCGKDFRALDRVYVPLDAFAEAGLDPAVLAAGPASPPLLGCIRKLALSTEALLAESAPLALQVADTRLAMEIAVIHRLASRLCLWLQARDPLSQRVHLSGAQSATLALGAMGAVALRRWGHRPAVGRVSGKRPWGKRP
jgi:squalene synthase HpnC